MVQVPSQMVRSGMSRMTERPPPLEIDGDHLVFLQTVARLLFRECKVNLSWACVFWIILQILRLEVSWVRFLIVTWETFLPSHSLPYYPPKETEASFLCWLESVNSSSYPLRSSRVIFLALQWPWPTWLIAFLYGRCICLRNVRMLRCSADCADSKLGNAYLIMVLVAV
jgi:hypothetical protein